MHSVERIEPSIFTSIRRDYLSGRKKWMPAELGTWCLDTDDHKDVVMALRDQFNTLCAYCERKCDYATNPKGRVDHFRPRELFSGEWLDWPNLVYACETCNASKDNKWPQSGYVNPNATTGKPAQEFFEFDFSTGIIYAADNLSYVERAMANATIDSMNLNSTHSLKRTQDPSYLPDLRQEAVVQISEKYSNLGQYQFEQKILPEILEHRLQFSTYIKAFFRL